MQLKIHRRSIFLFLAIFILVKSNNGQGLLRVHGKKIENDVQKDFIIRAMGLGGWMLQEGYMLQLGFLGQQYKIKNKIASIVGLDGMRQFYDQWIHFNTQKADIDSLASWGFNAIRLPLHYRQFTLPIEEEPVKGKNTWIPEGFNYLDTVLQWCASNHIYLILDLHAAPGGQGNDLAISDRNPEKPSLWSEKANQDKTIALWAKLANRYKNKSYIGGYDILNETNWGFDDYTDTRGTKEKNNKPLRNLMIQITKAIRKADKKHIIFLEGNGFANNYQGVFPLWDNNLVLSFHKYGNFTTEKTIQQFLDYREKYNVPLWLGESGENSNNWYTHTIRLMEQNDIGWSWWPLKKMGINNPLEIKKPKDYQQLIDFCAGKGPKPDPAMATEILQELIHNVQIQNNIFHPDVVDAMFRQIKDPAPIPFKDLKLDTQKAVRIQAADYDLGANGYAYNDLDTASYMYTPGVHTQGNRGRSYRNDGVDIKYNEKGLPVIFHIENGEWMHYTLKVPQSGMYQFSFEYSQPANDSSAQIQLLAGNTGSSKPVSLKPTGKKPFGQTLEQSVYLSKGCAFIKVLLSGDHDSLKDLEIYGFQVKPAQKSQKP